MLKLSCIEEIWMMQHLCVYLHISHMQSLPALRNKQAYCFTTRNADLDLLYCDGKSNIQCLEWEEKMEGAFDCHI